LGQFRREHGRKVGGFTPEASKALAHYDWPGNVRELENAIERATVLCRKVLIELGDLPEPIQKSGGRRLPPPDSLTALFAGEAMPLKDALEIPEQMILRAALERNHWNRQETARELQIDRTTLYKKMRRYKLAAEPVD
jgi:two-component system response regulator HydG